MLYDIQYDVSRRLRLRSVVPTSEQRYQISHVDGMDKVVFLEKKNIDFMHAFHTNKVDCEYYLSVAVFRRFFLTNL